MWVLLVWSALTACWLDMVEENYWIPRIVQVQDSDMQVWVKEDDWLYHYPEFEQCTEKFNLRRNDEN